MSLYLFVFIWSESVVVWSLCVALCISKMAPFTAASVLDSLVLPLFLSAVPLWLHTQEDCLLWIHWSDFFSVCHWMRVFSSFESEEQQEVVDGKQSIKLGQLKCCYELLLLNRVNTHFCQSATFHFTKVWQSAHILDSHYKCRVWCALSRLHDRAIRKTGGGVGRLYINKPSCTNVSDLT